MQNTFRTLIIEVPNNRYKVTISNHNIKSGEFSESLQTCRYFYHYFISKYKLNLVKLEKHAMYEPELFPALRYKRYNPLCVKIFGSGKVVILGLRTLEFTSVLNDIINDIKSLIGHRYPTNQHLPSQCI